MNSSSSNARRVRLRDRIREATAEAILAAAEEAFAEEGPRARMETIAAGAGIAVGTLYNHFADREALWEALCASRRGALLDALDASLAGGRSLRFEEALRAFLHAFGAHWTAHRGFLAVLMQADPLGRSPRPGTGRTMFEELRSRAAGLVRRGVAEGALRPDVAELAPALLLGMIRAVLFHHLAAAPAAAVGEAMERLVEVFLDGTRRRA